ncbi:unnamed protein product [Meganyctiphanes norvegica]|uniref:CD80-like immunoglobulin C2-set domain-containing protein n=1 Tax=Meganyctiphanes norvegica TaxID=48144 RepID=A0AAV2RRF3_MEGNR
MVHSHIIIQYIYHTLWQHYPKRSNRTTCIEYIINDYTYIIMYIFGQILTQSTNFQLLNYMGSNPVAMTVKYLAAGLPESYPPIFSCGIRQLRDIPRYASKRTAVVCTYMAFISKITKLTEYVGIHQYCAACKLNGNLGTYMTISTLHQVFHQEDNGHIIMCVIEHPTFSEADVNIIPITVYCEYQNYIIKVGI